MKRNGKKYVRFILHFSEEEEILLRFAMRMTGLDKTTTIRLLLRRGIFDELVRWNATKLPFIPEDLQKELEKVFLQCSCS